MPADPLNRVFRRARTDEAFLRALLKDPARALDDAAITLPLAQVRRLERLLLKGVTVDLPEAIRLSRRAMAIGPNCAPDPWPRVWTLLGSATRSRIG